MKRALAVLLCVGLALVLVGTALASQPISLVVNDQQLSPDVPPQVVGGRVLVPLRAVAEGLDAEVAWDDASRTVRVTAVLPEPPELYTRLSAIPWLLSQTRSAVDRAERPLVITGPDDFRREVEAALALLREKAPDAYWCVETYLSGIRLDSGPGKGPAYLEAATAACVFVSPDYPSKYDRLVYLVKKLEGAELDRTLLVAETIVHEAAHAQTACSHLRRVLTPDDDELVAIVASYRALERMGAPKAYLDLARKDAPSWLLK